MRLAAAGATLLVVCALAACGDDPEQQSASDRSDPAASAETPSSETSDADLLSLDAACARIWSLFKRHGDMSVGTSWDDLVADARKVLARSNPDLVAVLGPEVDAFENATIENYDRSQVFLAIHRGDRLVRDFAASCGDTIVRTIDRDR